MTANHPDNNSPAPCPDCNAVAVHPVRSDLSTSDHFRMDHKQECQLRSGSVYIRQDEVGAWNDYVGRGSGGNLI